ncbi:cysteine--tRNA ligase [Trichlorobacter lovleyi]|uniref:cysteine--tRNA ligase n=1 Tax=Trichlorobacter lovleyi TaxID=313985 RepID=UPI00223F1D34|nr:cysteine--tRNA ligase [Trichlorobacter lovleyi]QOX77635.1 cysteine--tRNA ligase [Trichlorobacter lovleyi]
MALRLYNTLSGEKEPFVPRIAGKVGMYVCGVTVYDFCHIGHARAGIVFDMIYRYLRFSGYDVTYIRNYTDIDDKIINRANQEGTDYRTIADRYIATFDEDMDRLGMLRPTIEPKATDHIEDIVAIIQRLIENGHAYAVDGDVYFAVETFSTYLKLSGRNLEDMLAGARVDVDERKRNPMDFALWKGSKPGEPFWQSPWGAGRPGWHIECSAMSMRFLGPSFDIHGGGKDLVFPHHENEIAQSEGANGCQFVKYWLHNGFVNINSEKMSKSLGNFFTIREVLELFDPETLRFFILQAHYRSPLDYSDQNLREAQAGLSRIYEALAALDLALEKPATATAPLASAAEFAEKVAGLLPRFKEAMDDDFNTAQALGSLFDVVRTLNRLLAEGGGNSSAVRADLERLQAAVAEIGAVLGLFLIKPSDWLAAREAEKAQHLEISPEEIDGLLLERAAARKNKDFKRSDEIRDYLLARDIQLLDTPQGTTWKVK